MTQLSRRGMFGVAGGGAAAGLAGFAGGWGASQASANPAPDASARTYPFFGAHQSGIVTPAQDRLYFAAFDVTASTRDDLETLLRAWSSAAERMMRGLPASDEVTSYDAPPADTGEADGLGAAGLTITFGFGPTLFRTSDGKDRFGLAKKQPKELRELPHFPADKLDPHRSGGDLCVQACADDPQIAVHAIRNLTRIAFGLAALRWAQLGFGRTSSTSTAQATPRNLFGFKDGTANLKAEDGESTLAEHVWVQDGDDDAAAWMSGGSYLMARKIRMTLEVWDRVRLSEQEQIMGRDKRFGAPLSVTEPSAEAEFEPLDLTAQGEDGPAIPADSHVAIVAPENNDGRRMLRRGYNYTDGNDSLGRLDAGLFFLAFTRDPRTGFYPVLERMTQKDALTEYLQHVGSALFAVLPGMREGDTMVGQRLFE